MYQGRKRENNKKGKRGEWKESREKVKERGRLKNLELGTVKDFLKRGLGKDFKRKNEKEKGKKRRQIKESNGSCHWEGFKLIKTKRERKFKKRYLYFTITYYLTLFL